MGLTTFLRRQPLKPSLDLDFLKQVYKMNLIQRAFADIFTFTRASGGGRINASGQFEWVAANQPRFDYDPVTLAAKGLLIEEQRANLCSQSNNFPHATWYGECSLTANAGLSPDGLNNAWLLTPAVSGNAPSQTSAGQNRKFTEASGGNQYALTIFVKTYLQDSDVTLFVVDQGSDTSRASKTVTSTGVWKRIEIAGTTSTSGVRFVIATRYPVLIFGAQIEQGSFATSYIPTSGSQVTRAADNLSLNTLAPWYSDAAGAFVAEFDTFGSSQASVHSFVSGNYCKAAVLASGNIVVGQQNVGQAASLGQKTAVSKVAVLSSRTADGAASLNGATPVTFNNRNAAGPATQINIGRAENGSSEYLNGHIRRFRFFPGQISAAQVQARAA